MRIETFVFEELEFIIYPLGIICNSFAAELRARNEHNGNTEQEHQNQRAT